MLRASLLAASAIGLWILCTAGIPALGEKVLELNWQGLTFLTDLMSETTRYHMNELLQDLHAVECLLVAEIAIFLAAVVHVVGVMTGRQ